MASVDNNGATAWDYARGRQLHYCMLIIASYIRQRGRQQEESGEEGNGHVNFGMNTDYLPIGQLQVSNNIDFVIMTCQYCDAFRNAKWM